MSTIQIKRGSTAAAPTTSDLVVGELAYAMDTSNDGAGSKLYIESTNSGGAGIHAIGGKYYTDIIDGATNANTASKLVQRDGSGNFSAGTITATLTGNVTGDVTGNADTATSAAALTTARTIGGVSFDGSANINLPGVNAAGSQDTSGNAATATALETARTIHGVSFDGSANIDLSEVIQDTVGAMFSSNTETGITATYQDGDGTIDLVVSETGDISSVVAGTGLTGGGTSGDVTVNVIGGTGITANANDIAITNTGVSAGDYGSATAVPTFTVNAQGQLTAAGTASISTSFDIAADTGTTNAVAGGETLTISGTSNEVTTAVSGNTVTVGLPDDVTIAGNLTVNGTTTTVDTTNLEVSDPLFALATGNNSADSVDIGFYGLYDTSGSQDLYAGFFRDASDSGKWKLFKDSQTVPTTTVNTGATGYAVGTLVANIEGNVTGNVTGSSGSTTGNAATATALATARTISGVSFDGTANITLDTDDIGEGSSNLYFTNSRFDTRLASSTIDGGTY